MEPFINEYQLIRPLYEDYSERLRILLKSLIDENHIKYHLIESRTKSLESFKEKLLRKEPKYSNPIEEMTDLSGIRIIVYYIDDVEKIEKIIKEEFIIDEQNSIDKRTLLKTNEFGYQSVHYVISLSKDRQKLPEWKKYSKFKAEIQIRTVLQHSWASISHELEYKTKFEIPSTLKRKLFRLASLIELADEEFKTARDQHIDLQKIILKGPTFGIDKNIEVIKEINLLTLKNYLNESETVKIITQKAIQAGFKRSTSYGDSPYISQIIQLCKYSNIATIQEFDLQLKKLEPNSYELFKAQRNESRTSWSGGPVFFILLLIIYANINNINDSTQLGKEGWGKEIADRVIKVFKEIKLK